METKPTSSVSAALWVIALALATIAVCLVVLVLRDGTPPAMVAAPTAAPAREPAPAWEPKPALKRLVQPVTAGRPGPSAGGVPEEAPPSSGPLPEVREQAAELAGKRAPETLPGGFAPLAEPMRPRFQTLVTGRVLLTNSPPPEEVIAMTEPCARLQTEPPRARAYEVGPDGGLANVLVRLQSGLAGAKFETPAGVHLVQFARCRLEPAVSAMMVNQRLMVTNADPVVHHFRWATGPGPVPPPMTLNPGGRSPGMRVGQPKLFLQIRCELHPWEVAHVAVLEHPFVAVTDSRGRFALPHLPPGEYWLEAIHPATHGHAGLSAPIRVAEGQVTEVDFHVAAPGPSPARGGAPDEGATGFPATAGRP